MSKITKKQLQEDIKSLESGIAMNWSDMKKIEVRLSRAMTDMATRISNISLQLEGQQRQIHLAADSIGLNKQAIIMLENKAEPKPQLKQLDQSAFDGLDEKWRFAAVNKAGRLMLSKSAMASDENYWYSSSAGDLYGKDTGYDASNWQNSLIERDIAKELTGSDLCRAMLGRGDKYVMCLVFDDTRNLDVTYVIRGYHDGYFHTKRNSWENAVPINNQGEPLTAAEAGL